MAAKALTTALALAPALVKGGSLINRAVQNGRRRRKQRQRAIQRAKGRALRYGRQTRFRSRQRNQPVRRNYRFNQTNMRVNTSNRNSVVVAHQEILNVVKASGNFAVQHYDINPGLSNLCNYASKFAAGYTQYVAKKFVVKYTPTVAGTQPGQIALNIFPDPTVSDPVDLSDLQNQTGAKFGSVTQPLSCSLSPANLNRNTRMFVRSGGLGGNDQRLMDIGTIFVGVEGCTGLTSSVDNIGQLTIDYVFEFFNTKLTNESSVASFHHVTTITTPANWADDLDIENCNVPDAEINSTGDGIMGSLRGWHTVVFLIADGTGSITSLAEGSSTGYTNRTANIIGVVSPHGNAAECRLMAFTAYFTGDFELIFNVAATNLTRYIFTIHPGKDPR